MPTRPRKPCARIGCDELTTARYCEKHRQNHRQYDKNRPNAAQRGYNSNWRRYREAYLRHNPLCVECEKEGRLMEATVLDHITPHKGDLNLFWGPNNHQGLCKRHHDRKTATQDGGFGNAIT